jgi:hypothetical protein
MEAAFCVETLEDALARHGKPEIFNTDQGSQFTGAVFTGVLIKNGPSLAASRLGEQPQPRRTPLSSTSCAASMARHFARPCAASH